MDYGKEAYNRVTELESRLGGSAAFSAAATEYTGECPSGVAAAVAEYIGGAAILTLTVAYSGSGNIGVYFGGVKAGEITAGGPAGTQTAGTQTVGTQTVGTPTVGTPTVGTQTLAFAAEEAGAVAVLPSVGVTVTRVSVSAAGVGAAFGGRGGKIAAGADGGNIVAAELSDGELRVSRLAGGEFTPFAFFPGAEDFDVAVRGDTAAVAYAGADGPGVIALVRIGDGSITAHRFFSHCRRIAVAFTASGLTAAVWDGSETEVLRLTDGLERAEGTRAHHSATVGRLALVKGADAPALVVCDNGRALLRRCADEARSELRLTLTAAAVTEDK